MLKSWGYTTALNCTVCTWIWASQALIQKGRRVCRNRSTATHIQRPTYNRKFSTVQLDQERWQGRCGNGGGDYCWLSRHVHYIESTEATCSKRRDLCIVYGLQDECENNYISPTEAFYRNPLVGNLGKNSIICNINLKWNEETGNKQTGWVLLPSCACAPSVNKYRL